MMLYSSRMLHNTNAREMALRIRKKISESGVCSIDEADLTCVWLSSELLTEAQKRSCVNTFSLHYGFIAAIDYGLACAVFRNSDRGTG
jgi:hypothetical protein